MPRASAQPEFIEVNRSELRQNQSSVLRKAKGRTVLVISAPQEGEEKIVLARAYFDDIAARLRAAIETLAITTDKRLFSRILAAAETLDADVRKQKLHSFEEAFGAK
jgi:glycosyltransferase A (GT-A) superfamily protein (DUF2064 family)